jgi:hypothetical protein
VPALTLAAGEKKITFCLTLSTKDPHPFSTPGEIQAGFLKRKINLAN